MSESPKWIVSGNPNGDIGVHELLNGSPVCFLPAYQRGSVIPNINNPEIRKSNARLIAAAPAMLEALKNVEMIIETARQYFPKSIRNSDTFALNLAAAEINKAIAQAEGKP